MIVKLCRAGGVNRYVEAVQVLQQPVASGRVDLEIVMQDGDSVRVLIGEEDPSAQVNTTWSRAYLMEKGHTVDTIRHAPARTRTLTKKEDDLYQSMSDRAP